MNEAIERARKVIGGLGFSLALNQVGDFVVVTPACAYITPNLGDAMDTACMMRAAASRAAKTASGRSAA